MPGCWVLPQPRVLRWRGVTDAARWVLHRCRTQCCIAVCLPRRMALPSGSMGAPGRRSSPPCPACPSPPPPPYTQVADEHGLETGLSLPQASGAKMPAAKAPAQSDDLTARLAELRGK